MKLYEIFSQFISKWKFYLWFWMGLSGFWQSRNTFEQIYMWILALTWEKNDYELQQNEKTLCDVFCGGAQNSWRK